MLLLRWNRVFNLTTIIKPREMVFLHIIDSLMVQPFLQGTHLLDIGTGAGLPGIPLAIANPQQQWVLLDKNSKKTRFLTQVSAELGLTNINIVHGHSKDFHPSSCFDSILSRALGSLDLFAKTATPFLCANGLLIAMKGKCPQTEIACIADKFTVSAIRLNIKGMNAERHVLCLRTK